MSKEHKTERWKFQGQKYKNSGLLESKGDYLSIPTLERDGNLYRIVYRYGRVYLSDIYPNSIHNNSIRLFGNKTADFRCFVSLKTCCKIIKCK